MELREGTGVWDGETQVAAVELSPRDGRDLVGVTVLTPLTIGRAGARALLDAVVGVGETKADGPPLVYVHDELVRNEARVTGWTGGLRQPLTRPDPRVANPSAVGRPPAEDPRITAVAALLPGTSVRRGGFSRHMLTLKVAGADGRTRIRLRLPDRDDLMPETVASAADTTLAVKRRFGRMASGVHALAFDHGGGQFADGSVAGSAESGTGTIFLNTNLAFADDLVEQRRRAAASGGRGVSAVVQPPFTALEGVTAHELWHNLDATIQSTPGQYVEFNRVLGEELGVATFEYALRGGEASAPPEWRAARMRIVQEVSVYATTNLREATAEMFKLWWCSRPELPAVTAGRVLRRARRPLLPGCVAQRPRHSGARPSAAARPPSAASSVAAATLRIVSPKRMASRLGRCCERTATSFVARAASGAARTSRAASERGLVHQVVVRHHPARETDLLGARGVDALAGEQHLHRRTASSRVAAAGSRRRSSARRCAPRDSRTRPGRSRSRSRTTSPA